MEFIKPKVKICCISSVEEAALAIEYGASAIGLVSEMPSGPGVISLELASKIAATIPPNIASFLLSSKQNALDIIEQQQYVGANTLQIVDRLTHGTGCFKSLRKYKLSQARNVMRSICRRLESRVYLREMLRRIGHILRYFTAFSMTLQDSFKTSS